MLLRTTTIWMLRRLAAHPMTWIGAGLCLGVWPLVVAFSPISLTMLPEDLTSLAGQAGWLGALGAILLAMEPLAESAWILQQARTGRAVMTSLAALSLAGTAGFLLAILGALLFAGELNLPWSLLFLSGCLSIAHLVALAWICLNVRVPETARSLCLLLSAWVLPSLAGGAGGLVGRVATVLDSQHTTRLLADPSPSGCAAELLPIVLLALAALLARHSQAAPHPPRR